MVAISKGVLLAAEISTPVMCRSDVSDLDQTRYPMAYLVVEWKGKAGVEPPNSPAVSVAQTNQRRTNQDGRAVERQHSSRVTLLYTGGQNDSLCDYDPRPLLGVVVARFWAMPDLIPSSVQRQRSLRRDARNSRGKIRVHVDMIRQLRASALSKHDATMYAHEERCYDVK